MKHSDGDDEFVSAGDKEQILCLADGEGNIWFSVSI